MSEPLPSPSPYQSPGADEVGSARELLGEQTYEIGCALQACYGALLLQFVCLIGIPCLAGLLSSIVQRETLDVILPKILLVLVTVAQAYSVWCTYRLTRAVRWHWALIALNMVSVAIPCIGAFMLMQITSPVREALEKAGVPFKHFGPDWAKIALTSGERGERVHYEPFLHADMNQLYNLVFCDDPALAGAVLPSVIAHGWPEPSAQLVEASDLQAIVRNTQADCRARLLAARQLRDMAADGVPETFLGTELGLGIVFESMPQEASYVVAFYADGGMVCLRGESEARVLPPGTEGLAGEVREFVAVALQQIGSYAPHPQSRADVPPLGDARITILTTTGIRVAQSNWKRFYKHPATEPVAAAAVWLVDRLYGFEPAVKEGGELDKSSLNMIDRKTFLTISANQRTVLHAMVVYGLASLTAVLFGLNMLPITFLIYAVTSLFGSFAAFRLMHSMNATGRGIGYALLIPVPVVGLLLLLSAYFVASQWMKGITPAKE